MPAITVTVPDLRGSGPFLSVSVAITAALEQALVARGNPVPNPQPMTALVDTGASTTVIQAGIAQALGLQPVGVVPTSTPSSTNVPMPLYAIRLLLPQSVVFETTALESPSLVGQGIQGLIGRDVLSQAVLVYLGDANQFTLAF